MVIYIAIQGGKFMSIEYLKKLKKLAVMSGIIASTTLFSGCNPSATTQEDESYESTADSEQQDDIVSDISTDYLNNKDDKSFENHDHLIVEIGNLTYIFRECDSNIGKFKYIWNSGSLQYWIYDNEGRCVLDGHRIGDINQFDINSEIEEESIREIEDELIEKGAILYKKP